MFVAERAHLVSRNSSNVRQYNIHSCKTTENQEKMYGKEREEKMMKRCKFSGGQKAKFGFVVCLKLATSQLVAFILTN